MSNLKISVTERDRNFCEEECHRCSDNHREVVLVNDSDDQKPLDKTKFGELINKLGKDLKVVELGGLKLDNDVIGLIANSGAAIECIRIYDCTGVTDEILKLLGQRFSKSLIHVELIGFSNGFYTNEGIKALILSIGNLEAIHIDSAIAVMASMPGTITNMKHVWSKVSGNEKELLTQFTIKYAQYLRNLDITLSATRSETPDFVAILGNLTNLFKMSVTATGDTPIDNQLGLIGEKFGPNFKELNICVWSGGDHLLEAVGKFTNLETLTINGRSPMRHIDFRLNTNLEKLSACKKLRHLRLILKNHNPNLYENIDTYLPQLEILELVGLDIGDGALKCLAKLKNISFLDIASPLLSDGGVINIIDNSAKLTWLRPNGSDVINPDHTSVGPKTLDAFTAAARKRQDIQFEITFNSNAKIDLDARKGSLPNNLSVKIIDTPFLLSFPGSTPRGF
ncbi:uncharacterized protein LOC128961087 [Oppia nitens]|uniref:uncharacterized protein LOC128961087 n=1 Tax=Oppia nitens TaxID=1686743 RepID=UPI0023D9FBC2|nr:uncharacterized protein LOC128961087 [Oppia nitens]